MLTTGAATAASTTAPRKRKLWIEWSARAVVNKWLTPERKMKMSVTTTVAASAWLARSAAKRIAPAAKAKLLQALCFWYGDPVGQPFEAAEASPSSSDSTFIAESRASYEKDATDAALQLHDEEELDELIHSLERSLSGPSDWSRWRAEQRGYVGMLARVSKRWQPCLKKYLDVMRAETARLEAHRAFLVDTRDKVYNFRVSRFGEPYRSDY